MSIEVLAKQGHEKVFTGLAGIETAKLRKMRNEGLRNCFRHLDETHYRMEYVATIQGRTFINDAASHNTNATWYALENTKGSIIWITEGSKGQNDYSKIAAPALRKVRMMICVGGNSEQLHENFSGIVPKINDVNTLGEAVHQAFYSNIDDATIIYSPATENGTSCDYQGEAFRHEVNEL